MFLNAYKITHEACQSNDAHVVGIFNLIVACNHWLDEVSGLNLGSNGLNDLLD